MPFVQATTLFFIQIDQRECEENHHRSLCLNCPIDPVVTVLMESGSFILSAPSGDLTPTPAGSPAPSMVPGKVGSALRLEGAELNYGRPTTECFYDVNLCNNGLSISIWVKFYASPTSVEMILDWGGFYADTKGMAIFRSGAGSIAVVIHDNSDKFNGQAFYDDWSHLEDIVFTWKASTNILLYLNGCLAGTQPGREPHTLPSTPVDFKIGGNLLGGVAQRGYIALDHVLMWYGVITPEEIWQLYVEGRQAR